MPDYPRWRNRPEVIDFPGAASTEVRGINNLGHVVGRYFAADGSIHGFFYDGAEFREVAFPGAYQTDAIGINDQGQIVGTYVTSTPDRQSVGFLFDAGQYAPILGPGGASAALDDINNKGEILGFSGDLTSGASFVLTGSTYRTVTADGARLTRATGLNDAGDVVGYAYFGPVPDPADPGLADVRGFSVLNQTAVPFPLAGQSYLEAINNEGWTVGSNFTGFWSEGTNLDRFLYRPADGSSLTLDWTRFAFDLNDSGQLVGYFADGLTARGFIATPVPEPSSCVLAAISIFGLIFVKLHHWR
jgi:uncharacterized membrane protein